MRPIASLSTDQAAGIRFVLTDIDDTLTSQGKLGLEAYSALWTLHRVGVHVVPVTGRPAGWCDLIARQWPVDAVIGENGAFVYYLSDEVLQEFYHPSIASQEVRERLEVLREEVLDTVPGTRVAKDQFARRFDLAIDFNEEPPHLGLDVANRVANICRRHGANAKISSIHVNAWFGDYDKLSMAQLFLNRFRGITPDQQNRFVLYCGDSPNDEPMFAHYPLSCGVANLKKSIDLLTSLPTFITENPNGAGFVELVNTLIEKRTSRQ